MDRRDPHMPPHDTIKIAIIDDKRLVREALTAMVNRLPEE